MDYLAAILIGAGVGWLVRGYTLLRKAKRDGRTLTRTEAARIILAGGKA